LEWRAISGKGTADVLGFRRRVAEPAMASKPSATSAIPSSDRSVAGNPVKGNPLDDAVDATLGVGAGGERLAGWITCSKVCAIAR
jgi:hypothetical protein